MADLSQDDVDDTGDDPSLPGTLSALNGVLGQMVDPTTTPEAQEIARGLIQDYRKGDPNQAEIENQLSANSENTRKILREARDRIAARRYDKGNKWLAAAAALGAPTSTGTVGETMSNLAQAELPIQKEEQKFNMQREDDVSEYDRALAATDDSELARRLSILQANQKNRADLAKAGLSVLGKRTTQTPTSKGRSAVDRAYAKEYVDFIQSGASDAAKSIQELRLASNSLKGLDRNGQPTKGGVDDYQTGPVVGLLPKVLRDVIPATAAGANTQELVESTVQRSLRPILGAQFTEREGERLIARVYNPRFSEQVNAQRVDRLATQLERAYQQKQLAAKYFEDHGTLEGFHGKTAWTVDDFSPDDTPAVPTTTPRKPTAVVPTPVAPKLTEGEAGGILQHEDLKAGRTGGVKKPKFQWPWQGWADGGEVDASDTSDGSESERKIVVMPDGTPVEADSETPDEEVISDYQNAAGSDLPMKGAEAGVGAALGYLGGKYGTKGAAKVVNQVPGMRIKPGEKKVLDLLDWSNTDPDFLASRLKDLQKKHVPAMMLDVVPPEVRGLAETAMLPKAKETGPLLDDLKARQKDTRFRVADQVNQALAPDPYEAQRVKLKQDRADNAKPLFDAADQAFPLLKSPELQALLETPSGQKAVKAARKAFKDQPGKSPYGPPDALGMSRSYSLQFLREVKERMDDLVTETAAKRPKEAGRIAALRDRFRDSLDAATTDPKTGDSLYKKARDQWASDSKIMEALEFGHDEYLKSSPEVAANYVKGLDFTGKDALRSGVAESLLRQLQGPYTDSNPAQKIAGSPDTMAKLEQLFDNPKQFEVFKEALAAEQDMFDDTRGTLNKGKSARGAYEPPESMVKKVIREKAPALGVFSPTYWALKAARKESKIGEKEADNILQILKTRDPALIQKTLGSKFRRPQKQNKFAGKVGMIGAALGAASPFIRALRGEPPPDNTNIPDDDPTLVGLTPEEIKGAKTPAYAKGGAVKQRLARLKEKCSA